MTTKNEIKTFYVYSLLLIVLLGIILVVFFSANLNQILYDPLQTPDTWFESHPYIEIGNTIISEPSSSVIVFILTVLTLWIGLLFLRNQKDNPFRFWWGVSLILTGLGAGLAGLSYQAFSFEIKCRGFENCLWTSWWEVAYMVCTVAGVSAAFIGIAYFSFSGKAQKFWSIYAVINTIVYVIIALAGTIMANRFLISFELMILFVSIGLFAISIQCIWYYRNKKEKNILKVVWVGAGLVFVITIYFVALVSNFANLLWEKGLWFNENDVLHVMMIGWVLLVYQILGKKTNEQRDS